MSMTFHAFQGYACAIQACSKAAWAVALALYAEMPSKGLQQNLHCSTAAMVAAGKALARP